MKIQKDTRNDVTEQLECPPLPVKVQVAVSADLPVTDADILQSVLNSFKWNTTIPDGRVTITVEDGNIILQGEVECEYQRVQAKSAIENITAVRSVDNLIKIKPACTPSEILYEINAAFQRSATADAKKITAEVQGTKIILLGVVRSFAEREDAENAAWSIPGVKSVESRLVIADSPLTYEEAEFEQYSNFPD
jgi:osmotically-inducible protein OsmY